MKFLRVGTWNVNGLAQRRNEVELFLNFNKLDILLISETHFTNKHYLKIKGFSFYDTKHPDGRAHGGSAILIKNSLKHDLLPSFTTDYLQATTVKLQDWHGDLVISAIYSPPRHRFHQQMFMDYFNTLGVRFVAGGDWNAKNQFWGSRLTSPRGRVLKEFVDTKKFDVLSSGEPTYWPTDVNKHPDLLDFFVVNGIAKFYFNVESSLDSSSDHSPIIATISTSVIMRKNMSLFVIEKLIGTHSDR